MISEKDNFKWWIKLWLSSYRLSISDIRQVIDEVEAEYKKKGA